MCFSLVPVKFDPTKIDSQSKDVGSKKLTSKANISLSILQRVDLTNTYWSNYYCVSVRNNQTDLHINDVGATEAYP